MATVNWQARTRRWLYPLIAALGVGAAIFGLLRLAGWPPAPFPQIVGQNCGRVTSGDIRLSIDPNQGELCLRRAYTACQAATLVYVYQGIDFHVTHAVTVQPKAGGCAVTDATQGSGSVGYGRTSPVRTYQCASIEPHNGGLLISGCGGEGDLFLPPPQTALTPQAKPTPQVTSQVEPTVQMCGIISNENHIVSAIAGFPQATVAGIEDCFWQAYTSCVRFIARGPAFTPQATLTYEGDIPPGGPDTQLIVAHTLAVQELYDSCALTDTVVTSTQSRVTYTCASLTRRAGGGLIAHACGAEGDLTILPATPPNK